MCFKCRELLYLAHPACFVCRKLVPSQNKITAGRTCKGCQDNSSIYAFFSPFSFSSNVIRELIHALKYSRVRSISEILAGLLMDYFVKYNVQFPSNSVLIPVPIHGRRKRRRGFNQAELIGQNLGFILNILMFTDVLKKNKYTQPQVELSRDDRTKNIVGTFSVRYPQKLKDKTILLLDDVKTTGATLEEAGRTLRNAGVKQVWAITVAH